MGLFRTLGKKAERFKQQAEEAARETYKCEACETQFHAAYDQCPECGNDDLQRG